MDTLAIFEESVGMSTEDFIRHAGAYGTHSVLSQEQAEILSVKIVASYDGKQPLVSRPSHLTPILYDSDWNYGALWLGVGIPPPRAFPSATHIRHSLLYSHAIYMNDPLPSILYYYSRSWDYHQEVLLDTLENLLAIRPIIKSNIIVFTRIPHPPESVYAKINRAFNDPTFLLFLRDIGVWGPRERNPRRTLPPEISARRSKVVHRAAELIEMAWSYEVLVGGGDAWVGDMERAVMSFDGTGADLWFPSERHARLYAGLRSHMEAGRWTQNIDGTANLDKIMAVRIPSIARLDPKDIVAIRQSSDVFEDWRQALSTALNTIDSSGRTDCRGAINAEMAAIAADMQTKLRAKRLEIGTGAARSFLLAGIGFAGSASMTGWSHWPTLLAGTASSAVGGAALDVKKGSKRYEAIGAARRHALLLSEDDKSGSSGSSSGESI